MRQAPSYPPRRWRSRLRASFRSRAQRLAETSTRGRQRAWSLALWRPVPWRSSASASASAAIATRIERIRRRQAPKRVGLPWATITSLSPWRNRWWQPRIHLPISRWECPSRECAQSARDKGDERAMRGGRDRTLYRARGCHVYDVRTCAVQHGAARIKVFCELGVPCGTGMGAGVVCRPGVYLPGWTVSSDVEESSAHCKGSLDRGRERRVASPDKVDCASPARWIMCCAHERSAGGC